MGALDAFGTLPQRCALAAAAGCDLLFVCRQIEAYPACVEAVEGSVSVARRAEAARRLEGYGRHLAGLREHAKEPRAQPASLSAEIRAFSEAIG